VCWWQRFRAAAYASADAAAEYDQHQQMCQHRRSRRASTDEAADRSDEAASRRDEAAHCDNVGCDFDGLLRTLTGTWIFAMSLLSGSTPADPDVAQLLCFRATSGSAGVEPERRDIAKIHVPKGRFGGGDCLMVCVAALAVRDLRIRTGKWLLSVDLILDPPLQPRYNPSPSVWIIAGLQGRVQYEVHWEEPFAR